MYVHKLLKLFVIITFNFVLVFRAPYLLVFTESALEVFDVNSAQWVQTVSLKKVNVYKWDCACSFTMC